MEINFITNSVNYVEGFLGKSGGGGGNYSTVKLKKNFKKN